MKCMIGYLIKSNGSVVWAFCLNSDNETPSLLAREYRSILRVDLLLCDGDIQCVSKRITNCLPVDKNGSPFLEKSGIDFFLTFTEHTKFLFANGEWFVKTPGSPLTLIDVSGNNTKENEP